MAEKDTIELLKECDAGIKMGTASMEQVMDRISNEEFRNILLDSKKKHEALAVDVQKLLTEFHGTGEAPNPIAQGMSWIKTNMMTSMDARDETIADLMTDGCDMGIKSLRKYLNQYEKAESRAKDLCRKIISTEEDLRNKMKAYL